MREDIFAGSYFSVNSIGLFAKTSSRENISNSLFAKISSSKNKVLYSIRRVKVSCVILSAFSQTTRQVCRRFEEETNVTNILDIDSEMVSS